MTEFGERSSLPRVTIEDLDIAWLEDIVEQTHSDRLTHFRRTNPDLLREISQRAFYSAVLLLETNEYGFVDTEVLKNLITNNVTLALYAVEIALDRQETSDGAYGEGRLHSNEPGDDQPAE